MKKKSRWYSNRFARNILTDKIRRDAVCATKKDFVILREELENLDRFFKIEI